MSEILNKFFQVPHFGLGLGIGVLDAALVPYLSSRIDIRYGGGGGGGGEGYSDISGSESLSANYGTVYTIQQTAVSLAYSASPLLASEVVKFVGFPTLMLIIGVFNIVYGPLLYYFTKPPFASSVMKEFYYELLEFSYPMGSYNLQRGGGGFLSKYKDYLLSTIRSSPMDEEEEEEADYNSRGEYNRFYNSIN